MDFKQPFLCKQIIAYIGNKRSLLPLIYKAVAFALGTVKPGIRFLDLFAGSGVVARLGKALNFEVFANDWEYYTYVINSGMIQTSARDLTLLFGSIENFQALLDTLNQLPLPAYEEQYIARYYAPCDDDVDKADFRTERLFYTRANALTIDKIRNYIDATWPPGVNDKIRHLLISLLLYEAATHTNTSGVFKACHKGFGGHNKDAIQRICAPIRLSLPPLIDADYPVHIFRQDANILAQDKALANIDIVYLDPPYNQHQYGSNYHMLNTIALWDKPSVPLELNEKGVLKQKAAIRKDWIKTKSDYCYQEKAIAAFSGLMTHLTARHILISYSTDGIIPFDVMRDICLQKGKVSIITNEYTKYKGGKQSNGRLNTNIEFILVVDTQQKATVRSVKTIQALINKKRLYLMFKQKYAAQKLAAYSQKPDTAFVHLQAGSKVLAFPTLYHFELFPIAEIDNLSDTESAALYAILSTAVCSTKEEELTAILAGINGDANKKNYFIRLIPNTLKKLAHKKNKVLFYHWLAEIQKIEAEHDALFAPIKEKLKRVEELAELRFQN